MWLSGGNCSSAKKLSSPSPPPFIWSEPLGGGCHIAARAGGCRGAGRPRNTGAGQPWHPSRPGPVRLTRSNRWAAPEGPRRGDSKSFGFNNPRSGSRARPALGTTSACVRRSASHGSEGGARCPPPPEFLRIADETEFLAQSSLPHYADSAAFQWAARGSFCVQASVLEQLPARASLPRADGRRARPAAAPDPSRHSPPRRPCRHRDAGRAAPSRPQRLPGRRAAALSSPPTRQFLPPRPRVRRACDGPAGRDGRRPGPVRVGPTRLGATARPRPGGGAAAWTYIPRGRKADGTAPAIEKSNARG